MYLCIYVFIFALILFFDNKGPCSINLNQNKENKCFANIGWYTKSCLSEIIMKKLSVWYLDQDSNFCLDVVLAFANNAEKLNIKPYYHQRITKLTFFFHRDKNYGCRSYYEIFAITIAEALVCAVWQQFNT